jgi:hypothetical protein
MAWTVGAGMLWVVGVIWLIGHDLQYQQWHLQYQQRHQQ